MPKIDIKPLAELFRANVLRMLKKEGKKITYNDETGTVIYKFKKIHRKSKGGRKNFQFFTAAEFIAAITHPSA